MLILQGVCGEVLAAGVGMTVLFESRFPGGAVTWLVTCGSVAFLSLALGLVLNVLGIRKGKREIAAGYTTALNVAKDDPSLALRHWRSLALLSPPQGARPTRLIR
jgi:hypothetical protein